MVERLLTHRLIVIWYAAKHNWSEFYYSGEGPEVFTNLNGFQSNIKDRTSKSFLNTILGFNQKNASNRIESKLMCSILLENFFPEEINWLSGLEESNLECLFISSMGNDLDLFYDEFMSLVRVEDLPEETSITDAVSEFDNLANELPQLCEDQNLLASLKRINDDYPNVCDNLPSILRDRIEKIKDILTTLQ